MATPLTGPEGTEHHEVIRRGFGRRRLLAYGLGGVAAVAAGGVTGLELISHGVLRGQLLLDEIEGKCSAPSPQLRFSSLGPSRPGTFYSRARNRTVGYTLAYPPGHGPGSRLPLVVMLHGFGADHATALVGMTPAQALALRVGGVPLAPMALVTVDGGGSYWNRHRGDERQAIWLMMPAPAGWNCVSGSSLRARSLPSSAAGCHDWPACSRLAYEESVVYERS